MSGSVSVGDFHGPNAGYLEELRERLRADPDSVPERERRVLARIGTVRCDAGHLRDPERRAWFAEARSGEPVDKEALLRRLTQVDAFERFCHSVFPGRTRFSLEGLDMLVPVLDEWIGQFAEDDGEQVVLGMSHRGRLNVLAHVLGRGYEPIFAEFKHDVRARAFRDDAGWSGDVTYHEGARHAVRAGAPRKLLVTMPPNPSHVELVDPVIAGMARAAGTAGGEGGAPRFDPAVALPVVVHGDAAFHGEGVLAETLNLASIDGYRTGGALHVIANNELGYTTEPEEGRATPGAGDPAKGYGIPVIHADADDPLACIEAARIAYAYRKEFGGDVVVDLQGYRRHGHNEGDEPAFTQPVLYARIRERPRVRELWAGRLVEAGAVGEARVQELLEECRARLQEALESVEEDAPVPEREGRAPPEEVDTSVALEDLRACNRSLMDDPEDFALHPKIEKARKRRRAVLDDEDEPSVDWATAEDLALATILAGGTPVRLTGQDTARGTFSQRHAVLHDVEDGKEHVPLQALEQAEAAFEVRNSPLCENAALGFEYGYQLRARDALVIWEAQYGDFVNNAQSMIDEFLLSGEAKWKLASGLVLLLPHGHEGQGPDHSSARPERFLSLAADGNFRLVNCTTAAQYFHVLREQAARLDVPLVVLTPKSLLRHERVASAPRELAEGRFRPVIGGAESGRVVLCSGKLAIDLLKSGHDGAVVRLEQLYPFPRDDVEEALDGHDGEIVWAQEEPRNMGAWPFLEPRLRELAGDRGLAYVGRDRSSSPAEGASAWHRANQEALVDLAFGEGEPPAGGMIERS